MKSIPSKFIEIVMRHLLWVVLFIMCVASGFAQSYRAKSGETALVLNIEGRGEVAIKLYTDKAPKTTQHIIELVKNGFYNGLRFHRADRSPKPYLVQVGDPASRNGVDNPNIGSGGSGTRIPYEDSGFTNVIGAVGLARVVQDRDSGDSQFYILLGASRFLDGHYTVFGQVVSGMDIVNKIEKGDRIASARIVTG